MPDPQPQKTPWQAAVESKLVALEAMHKAGHPHWGTPPEPECEPVEIVPCRKHEPVKPPMPDQWSDTPFGYRYRFDRHGNLVWEREPKKGVLRIGKFMRGKMLATGSFLALVLAVVIVLSGSDLRMTPENVPTPDVAVEVDDPTADVAPPGELEAIYETRHDPLGLWWRIEPNRRERIAAAISEGP